MGLGIHTLIGNSNAPSETTPPAWLWMIYCSTTLSNQPIRQNSSANEIRYPKSLSLFVRSSDCTRVTRVCDQPFHRSSRRHSPLTLRADKVHFNITVGPKFLHGFETWSIQPENLHWLPVLDHRSLKNIGNIGWQQTGRQMHRLIT